MKLYHIAALSENHVIGQEGKIPWLIKDDLKRFKEITKGHPVIMGRKTFESLGPHFPLKERMNIVVSSKKVLHFDGRPIVHQYSLVKKVDTRPCGTSLTLVASIEEALSLCEDRNEVYIIGGGGLYQSTMDIVDELRLTIVHKDVPDGDAFYPEVDPYIWTPSYTEPFESHTYIDYVRK
jgi:dihydrofolate reductase